MSVDISYSKTTKTVSYSANHISAVHVFILLDDARPTPRAPARHREADDEDYAKWNIGDREISSASTYRIAWRKMAATTGFRTLYPAIIPPGPTHIDGIISSACGTNLDTVLVGATTSSVLSDYIIRAMGVQNIHGAKFELLPMAQLGRHMSRAVERYLRLNCLTSAYAPLWEEITGEEWTVETPIRNAKERFHAQNDIDVIVALSFGIAVDELCMIYRTQFPVMRRYDQEDHFDARGRKIPKEILKAHLKFDEEQLSEHDRTWAHPQSGVSYTFEYPFAPLDREADLRRAYEEFESK